MTARCFPPAFHSPLSRRFEVIQVNSICEDLLESSSANKDECGFAMGVSTLLHDTPIYRPPDYDAIKVKRDPSDRLFNLSSSSYWAPKLISESGIRRTQVTDRTQSGIQRSRFQAWSLDTLRKKQDTASSSSIIRGAQGYSDKTPTLGFEGKLANLILGQEPKTVLNALQSLEIHYRIRPVWMQHLYWSFRCRSNSAKFFTSFAQPRNKCRGATVSCNDCAYQLDTPEINLKTPYYQLGNTGTVRDAIQDYLAGIQFATATSNLQLKVDECRPRIDTLEYSDRANLTSMRLSENKWYKGGRPLADIFGNGIINTRTFPNLENETTAQYVLKHRYKNAFTRDSTTTSLLESHSAHAPNPAHHTRTSTYNSKGLSSYIQLISIRLHAISDFLSFAEISVRWYGVPTLFVKFRDPTVTDDPRERYAKKPAAIRSRFEPIMCRATFCFLLLPCAGAVNTANSPFLSPKDAISLDVHSSQSSAQPDILSLLRMAGPSVIVSCYVAAAYLSPRRFRRLSRNLSWGSGILCVIVLTDTSGIFDGFIRLTTLETWAGSTISYIGATYNGAVRNELYLLLVAAFSTIGLLFAVVLQQFSADSIGNALPLAITLGASMATWALPFFGERASLSIEDGLDAASAPGIADGIETAPIPSIETGVDLASGRTTHSRPISIQLEQYNPCLCDFPGASSRAQRTNF
ncbi:hypothetical protein NA57DRAFT_53140 [Rhizodiscina lignyota]|uniref:Uncharacterized protein n=1 Tax=Rhizodiscina lignyota TaxID=1504668 RepID=A0A9P4IN43_9PEZI|nr:hypothetical protein NA57DRAFT_53140 [Rhizodiscina lignyota]